MTAAAPVSSLCPGVFRWTSAGCFVGMIGGGLYGAVLVLAFEGGNGADLVVPVGAVVGVISGLVAGVLIGLTIGARSQPPTQSSKRAQAAALAATVQFLVQLVLFGDFGIPSVEFVLILFAIPIASAAFLAGLASRWLPPST